METSAAIPVNEVGVVANLPLWNGNFVLIIIIAIMGEAVNLPLWNGNAC